MLYACRGKIPKETVALRNSSAAHVMEPSSLIDFEAVDEEAYAFTPDGAKNGTSVQSKNYACGPKPNLTRQCSTIECPLNSGTETECRDDSEHCQLYFLQRYCALPQFRSSCCQTCNRTPQL